MGSWSVSCGISNITISAGMPCVLIPITEMKVSDYQPFAMGTLPIKGSYDDYGGIESIKTDANTKMIEDYFGVSIDEFCEFIVDGKFTFGRDEANEIGEKMQHLDEVSEMRFTWIHGDVYDYLSKSIFDAYDCVNATNWKAKSAEDRVELLYFLNLSRHSFSSYMSDLRLGISLATKLKNSKNLESQIKYKEIIDSLNLDSELPTTDFKSHYAKKFVAGDEAISNDIVDAYTFVRNLFPFGGALKPHLPYVTPQCGEYEVHSEILAKFKEINDEGIYVEEEDE